MYKQPVYKQLARRTKFLKQLLEFDHLAVSINIILKTTEKNNFE